MASPPVTGGQAGGGGGAGGGGQGWGSAAETQGVHAAAEQDSGKRCVCAALAAHGEGLGHSISQGHMVHGLQAGVEVSSEPVLR